MFPYRVQYADSESDIQNNDLSYKIDQQCQNTFEMLENVKNIFYFVICINSIILIL